MKLPFLLSVPHAGLRVPEEVRRYCRLTPEQIVEDGDEGAAEIYDLASEVVAFLISDVARAIVDLNRAENDRRPDGVVKTHTVMNVPIYDPFPPDEILYALLERYYRPYHRDVRELAASPAVRLSIDCHTMLAVGPPIGPGPGVERPRICISDGNGLTCPREWFEIVVTAFREFFECEIAQNDPFSGGYITRTYGAKHPWIQVELSRAPFASNSEKRRRLLRALRITAERLGASEVG